MFGNQNLLIDESEDNDFTSKTYNRASTSKPLDKSNREPIIARNLISSESKNSYNANFTRPSSGANFENPASNQTKNYDNFSNPKPNFLDKLKTTNPTFTNPSNLFRPGTSSFTKKEDNYEAKEEVSYQKSNENKGNDFNGMKKPENTTILRAQSSQSQSNM